MAAWSLVTERSTVYLSAAFGKAFCRLAAGCSVYNSCGLNDAWLEAASLVVSEIPKKLSFRIRPQGRPTR